MSEVAGKVNWVLRTEGLVVFALAAYIYFINSFSWLTFVVVFLVPDLSFFGYLINSRLGAVTYNAAHSFIGALLVCGVGLFLYSELIQTIGLIWVAHIGFDRALGYGLKYSAGFGHTHLGRIGRSRNT